MLIGYLRGRAGDEGSLRAQRKALADGGGERVVEDLAVGGRWEQPELRRALGRSFREASAGLERTEAARPGTP